MPPGTLTTLIIAANLGMTWFGFGNPAFFERYLFSSVAIRYQKQYYRIFTSGFLHVNWLHLALNMISLFAFGELMESVFGSVNFIVLYAVSLVAGNAFSLVLNNTRKDHRSVGASGAISGVVFAFVALYPTAQINLFLFLNMPAWLFGILYIAFSTYGMRTRMGNIGHDAHLGGAIGGLLVTIALLPEQAMTNKYYVLILLAFTIVTLLIAMPGKINDALQQRRRMILKAFQPAQQKRSGVIRQMPRPVSPQATRPHLDHILEKVKRSGLQSLTPEERNVLDSYSDDYR